MKSSLYYWAICLLVSTLTLTAQSTTNAPPANGCTVEGVVMDEYYAVIPNMEIELVGPKKTYTARSDVAGQFRFTGVVVDGQYELRPAARERWTLAYKMRPLSLRPSKGQRRQHIDLILRLSWAADDPR